MGRITIGDFSEEFPCSTHDASIDDLPKVWLTELQVLLDGAPAIALVYDPRFAWIVYREGDDCFVQERFAPDSDFRNIPERETVSDDEQKISEWTLKLSAIREHLETQQRS